MTLVDSGLMHAPPMPALYRLHSGKPIQLHLFMTASVEPAG